MKNFLNNYGTASLIHFVIFIGILLLIAHITSSDASEGDKIVTKGYQGSEVIRLVEKPLSSNHEITTSKGWIGDNRVNLRTTPQGTTTVTRGWIGDEYIRTQNDSKGDSDGD